MDGISNQISFNFEISNADIPNLTQYWQIVSGVVGDFSITVHDKVLYKEKEFCLVEFAVQATQWLKDAAYTGADFSYTSMESENEGLIRIKKDNQGWSVSALYQEYQEANSFSFAEISKAINDYVCNLERLLPDNLKDKVNELLSGNASYEATTY